MGMGRQSAPSAPVPVLVTRPLAEGRAFATALTDRFGTRVRPVLAPLMALKILTPALPPGPFTGVIFTSAAGVEAALRLKPDLPQQAWCVGRKTADRATAAGFHARSADGDADALVAAILADPPNGRLLHLSGEDTRGEVAERLVSAGIQTVSLTVYRQDPQPLTAETAALLASAGPVILPLFSPRSATLFHAAMPPDSRATLHFVAMSAAVAEAARAIPHRALTVATELTAEGMLDACGKALEAAAPP
jgi:uroporphyrinogen-III synthase